MSSREDPVRRDVARHLAGAARVVDLGCGDGATLAVLSEETADQELIGIDREIPMRADAQSRPATSFIAADLNQSVPLRSGSVDAVISYNALEVRRDPRAHLDEASRVLRPGGTAVLSHADYESLMFNSINPYLDRRIVRWLSDHSQAWLGHADARMGRKLPGLVGASPLEVVSVDVHVASSVELAGYAARRVDEITALCKAHGSSHFAPPDIFAWRRGVDDAAKRGEFFYAETTVIVAAMKP